MQEPHFAIRCRVRAPRGDSRTAITYWTGPLPHRPTVARLSISGLAVRTSVPSASRLWLRLQGTSRASISNKALGIQSTATGTLKKAYEQSRDARRFYHGLSQRFI